MPRDSISQPIAPPRPPLALTGTVGRGGQNNAADVQAVQDRLVELRAIDAPTIAPERPSGTSPVPESALPLTIGAIESFQRLMAIDANGRVDVSGGTRLELDRAIPVQAPDELAAVAGAVQGISQTIRRGLTLAGAVGATDIGNAAADVRAVQRRLVEVGALAASHTESPAANATGTVPQGRLPATIAALRRFQKDVRFFVAKGSITGAVTPGVVNAGDATAALLDRISVYTMTLGPARLSFRDHVASAATQHDTGVAFQGTASPAAIGVDVYNGVGLDPAQAAALKVVSSFEGNFDAINTYDRANVSAGFIQFAGGRGLPPYMALLKVRQAGKFRELLQKYGIDVEVAGANGAIVGARLVVLDPAGTRVLRATAAETAIRGDKRLTAAMILAGRDRDVHVVQLEAAARGYVAPILNATVTPSGRAGRMRLGDILRSQKGLAAMFDRAIQEGVAAATQRFQRVIQRVVQSSEARPPQPPSPPPTLQLLQRREGDILAELERDLQAAAQVSGNIARARAALQALTEASGQSGAAVAAVLARPELATARQAVTAASAGVDEVVNAGSVGNVDALLKAVKATLVAEERRLALTPPPASAVELANLLAASRRALDRIVGPFATAPAFLERVRRIRRSSLDAGLTVAA